MPPKVKKILVSCLRISLVVYLVILIGFFIFQKKLIFKPSSLPASTQLTPAIPGSRELSLKTSSGGNLSAVFTPAPATAGTPRRVIMHCHGNAGNILGRLGLIGNYHRHNCASLVVDWCGYGKSSGSPNEDEIYADAELGFSWLKEQGWKEDEIIIHGTSLGGGPATWLAKQHPGCAGLILSCTFTGIADMARDRYPFIPPFVCTTHFDNLGRIAEIKMPLLILHGTQDSIVRYQHSERLYAAAVSPRKKLILVPDTGHNELDDSKEFWQVFSSFVAGSEIK